MLIGKCTVKIKKIKPKGAKGKDRSQVSYLHRVLIYFLCYFRHSCSTACTQTQPHTLTPTHTHTSMCIQNFSLFQTLHLSSLSTIFLPVIEHLFFSNIRMHACPYSHTQTDVASEAMEQKE